MRQLRKLPKEIKGMGVCQVLEENMRGFKDSIPLFADLKNEALRERYVNYITCNVYTVNWENFKCNYKNTSFLIFE